MKKFAIPGKLLPITLILASTVLEAIISPLRGYCGMEISSVGGFIAFLLATYYFLTQYGTRLKPYQITIYCLLGLMLIQVPMRVVYFKDTLISLPDFLVHLLGVFAGLFFYLRKKIFYTINLSVSVLIVLFVYFYGYNLWMNKVDYDSFSGSTHFEAPANIALKGLNNETITVPKGKLIIMDFWFIGCKPCFDAFPEFQKLYTSYKSNPKVQFYSINKPFRSDNGENCFQLLSNRGYTFPMAVCSNFNLTTDLKVKVYPTIVIMDPGGYVIYKGDIDGVSSIIKPYL